MSFRELLQHFNSVHGHNLKVDDLVNRVASTGAYGTPFEWWDHPDVLGSLMASKFSYW